MNPWDLIGWLVAVPLAVGTTFFLFGLVVALCKLGAKRALAARSRRQFEADHPAYGRSHLRVVPDRD